MISDRMVTGGVRSIIKRRETQLMKEGNVCKLQTHAIGWKFTHIVSFQPSSCVKVIMRNDDDEGGDFCFCLVGEHLSAIHPLAFTTHARASQHEEYLDHSVNERTYISLCVKSATSLYRRYCHCQCQSPMRYNADCQTVVHMIRKGSHYIISNNAMSR